MCGPVWEAPEDKVYLHPLSYSLLLLSGQPMKLVNMHDCNLISLIAHSFFVSILSSLLLPNFTCFNVCVRSGHHQYMALFSTCIYQYEHTNNSKVCYLAAGHLGNVPRPLVLPAQCLAPDWDSDWKASSSPAGELLPPHDC